MAFLVVPLFSSVYCYLKKYRRFEKQSNLDSVMNKTSEMLNSFQDTFCDQSASLYPDGFFFCVWVCVWGLVTLTRYKAANIEN